MVRAKRKGTSSETSQFNWFKRSREDDEDNIVITDNPQISLFLKEATHYKDSLPLPYELLIKIFKHVLASSGNPLKDLCSIARVCEEWRQIVLQTSTLWFRLDLTELPATARNLKVLDSIISQNPSIMECVNMIGLSKTLKNSNSFIEKLLSAPNLEAIRLQSLSLKSPAKLCRSIRLCKKLTHLSITNSQSLVSNQKWLSDYLFENGKHLKHLDLAMSLSKVSSQLFRSISQEFCPNLRVLDLSTYVALATSSFDAILLTVSMPNLIILRVANVSFKRVFDVPEDHGLKKLEELSMPIAMRDADRDDALFATLTYGSDRITTLDLRGSCISAFALVASPSYHVRELHIDDICPIMRSSYRDFIKKWYKTLEVLSLVKINCSETVKNCLKALYEEEPDRKNLTLKELDLSSSDVTTETLKEFLGTAHSLNYINLYACRSLPRGCKNRYSRFPQENGTLSFIKLHATLGKN